MIIIIVAEAVPFTPSTAIVLNISDAKKIEKKDAVCVMVGDQDVLMDLKMSAQSAAGYRDAMNPGSDGKKLEAASLGTTTPVKGTEMASAAGVRLVVVKGAGHHLQNDVQRDAGSSTVFQLLTRRGISRSLSWKCSGDLLYW